MLRVVSHPLGPVPAIEPRLDSWRPALDGALIEVPGYPDLTRRLHQPGALVVTTGQQPGLFTGPAYTLYKALAAATLARELEQRWRRPVIPLFWIAGDDHDYAEASVASWPDQSGSVVDWRLPPRPASLPQLPLSEELLPPEVLDGLRSLEAALPAGIEREETLALLRRHYAPGVTLHAAFAGALAELVAPFGIVCFDPTALAAKRAQVPVLQAALRRAAELDSALGALPAPDTGITAGRGATLVFVTTSAGRDRLLIDGAGFRARRSGERIALQEIDAMLDADPGRFSANVLLRPVVESALLPTVAYVAGPAELGYLSQQVSAVYPLLQVPAQVPVPRWSGTIIGRSAERLLGRLHLTAQAVLQDDGTTARLMLERDFPGDARQAIDALQKQITRSGGVIGAAGARIDPVLERAVAGRLKHLADTVDQLESVLLRHLRKRDNIAHAQFMRLAQGLRPHGKPQERVFCGPAFLGRYGSAWLSAVFEAMTPWAESLPKARE